MQGLCIGESLGIVLVVQAIRRLLAEEFPELNFVETSTLHRGVAGARHSFLPSPPAQNKLDVLAQVSSEPASPLRCIPVSKTLLMYASVGLSCSDLQHTGLEPRHSACLKG